ncbi:2'-5' RNA ligase family protein [Luteococcus sp. OSA5]|uniref:2'-5' RNA ligase family protein n=1 Tax=Luteococcus sp. OSA5 TaxID=3401630 RepID=UPI003B42E246
MPVLPLEDFVRRRTLHHDDGFLGHSEVVGESFVHAHVTLLGPFDAVPDQTKVGAVLRGVRAFDYRLAELDVFPNGIIHAVPSPSEGFSSLTTALRTAFPAVLPYRGQFPVRPHVTLEALSEQVTLAKVREWTSRVLPTSATAEAVDLVWYESGNTRLVQRWRLANPG